MKIHVKRKVHGLRQRWMANSMSVVAAIMLMVCGLFSASIATYYYNTVQNALIAQAKAAVSFMNCLPLSGYDEYYALAYSYTQNFRTKIRSSCSSSTPTVKLRCRPIILRRAFLRGHRTLRRLWPEILECMWAATGIPMRKLLPFPVR